MPNTLLRKATKALGAWSSFLWGELGKGNTDAHGFLKPMELCCLGTTAATSELQSRLGSVALSWKSIQDEHRDLGTAVHPGCCLERIGDRA